jgi:hypothetical protein
MTIRADLADLDHRYRAKRTGQTKAEYASAIEIHRRPVSWKTRALQLAAAALVLGAICLGAMS